MSDDVAFAFVEDTGVVVVVVVVVVACCVFVDFLWREANEFN